MSIQSKLGSIVFIATLLMASGVQAVASKEDVEAVASRSLVWALSELAGAKTIPASAKINVIDYNLPEKVEIKLPGRSVAVTSLVRLQSAADLSESIPAFIFSALVVHEDTAKVSISLKVVASAKTGANPSETEGAVLQLERHGDRWDVNAVNERWP